MKPPDDLKEWSKNDLVREVRRLRAIMHEHSTRVGDDPREAASMPDPLVGGGPHERGGTIIDTRAAVLLESTEVVLVDRKKETEPVVSILALTGRVNYANDKVTHVYVLNGDGAAAIVTELAHLAVRASGMKDDAGAQEYAADFKVAMEERMRAMP